MKKEFIKKELRKQVLLLSLSILLFVIVVSEDYILIHDDADMNVTESILSWSGAEYRAVKVFVEEPCTLKTFYWGRTTVNSEMDTIFIWKHNPYAAGPYNDSVIFSTPVRINSGGPEIKIYNFTETVIVNGIFWLGIYSQTNSTPPKRSLVLSDTMAVDSGGSGNSWFLNGNTWYPLEDAQSGKTGDYVIRALVSGPTGILTYIKKDKYVVPEEISEKIPTDLIMYNRLNASISFINDANINVFDIAGRNVLNGFYHKGNSLRLNIKNGVYFAIAKSGFIRDIIKIIVAKK